MAKKSKIIDYSDIVSYVSDESAVSCDLRHIKS